MGVAHSQPSPDGTKLAFTSARTGKMDIYVMDLDLVDLRKEIEAINRFGESRFEP